MAAVSVVKGEHPIDASRYWTRDGKPSRWWWNPSDAEAAEEHYRDSRRYYGTPLDDDDMATMIEDPHNWTVRELPSRYRMPDGSAAVFVNVYDVGRVYGGPEEGGWWYDVGDPIESYICATYGDAEAVRDRLAAGEYARTGARSSVRGGPDFEIYIEVDPGESFPKHRPHYE
jgi:hypothetical protein